jgi:hypothetical protein
MQLVTGLMMQSILQLLPKQVQMLLLQVVLLQMLWLLLRRPSHLLQQHTSGISNISSIMGHNSSRRKHVSLLQPRLELTSASR